MKKELQDSQNLKNQIEDLISYLKIKKDWEPADFFLHASILSFVRMSAGLRERTNTSLLEKELLLLGTHPINLEKGDS